MQKLLECTFGDCKKTFKRNEHLQVHTRHHLGIKPYSCDFENYDYKCTTSGSLTTHKRTHTNDRPYKCDYENCESANKCAYIDFTIIENNRIIFLEIDEDQT